MTDEEKLQALYGKLVGEDGEFTDEDYVLVTDYYHPDIPYGVIEGRDGMVDEWFVQTWDRKLDAERVSHE